MKTYELVCVIDAGLPKTEIDAVADRVVAHLEKAQGTIVATDDIGLLPTAYPINGQDQAYYLSLHIQVPAEALTELRETFGLEKGLTRTAFYSMKDTQKFFTYSELSKRYEETLDLPEQEEVEEEASNEE